MGDGLYLRTPSTPFHTVSISKEYLGSYQTSSTGAVLPRELRRGKELLVSLGAALFCSHRMIGRISTGCQVSLLLVGYKGGLPSSPQLFTNIPFCSLALRGKSGRLGSTCLPLSC